MTRELKFRIWDKKESEYMCLGATAIDAITGEVVDYYWEGRKLEKEDYIVEQYTGLKDKNGKEIYEGDIVTIEPYTKPFKVVFDKQYVSFAGNNATTRRLFNSLYSSDYEVIGNIHENPELLKGGR